MRTETEVLMEGDSARIRTTDAEVIAQLDALPDARAVDEDGEQSYVLSREALALHLPHLEVTGG